MTLLSERDDGTGDPAVRAVPAAPAQRLPSLFRGTERFAVEAWLGEGSFGIVYRALDRQTGGRVALKLLRRPTPEWLYRFKREFDSVVGIVHPNLVSLLELFAEGDDWFFTMQLVDGCPVLDALRPAPGTNPREDGGTAQPRADQVEPGRLVDLFGQIACGLNALHDAGIVHRDLKPSNILVSSADHVCILDFGLALHSLEVNATVVTSFAGTPAYIAPELWDGTRPSPASDWFSVGVMLFQALTARLPPAHVFGSDAVSATLQEAGLHAEPLVALAELTRDLLAADPAARPDGKAVVDRLERVKTLLSGSAAAGTRPSRGSTVRTALKPPAGPALIGRDAQLDELRRAFDSVVETGTGTVHVVGESGVGKTSLAERYLDEVSRERAALVLRARCHLQASLPYKALDGVVDAVCHHLLRLGEYATGAILPRHIHELARLFPVLGRVPAIKKARRRHLEFGDVVEAKRHAFVALRELLDRLSLEHPLVIWLDDVQWGDAESGAVLRALLGSADPPWLQLLLTYRSGARETAPFLRALDGANAPGGANPPMRVVSLGPLNRDDAALFVRAMAPKSPPLDAADVSLLVAESGGNPLLLGELARVAASLRADIAQRDAGTTAPAGSASPSWLAAMIEERLASLTEPWRRLVAIVAIAGQPIAFDIARKAAGLEVLDGAILRVLRLHHLLGDHAGPGWLSPYHDRIREAVTALIAPSEGPRLHEALALALGESGPGLARLASTHFKAAGKLDEAALHAAVAAEQASAALAFDDAANLYAGALEGSTWSPERRRDLLLAHASALAGSGRCLEAAPIYDDLASSSDSVGALQLRRRAFEQYYTGGMRKEALDILERTFRQVGLSRLSPIAPTKLGIALELLRLRWRGIGFVTKAVEQIPPEELLRIDLCYSATRTMLQRDSLAQVHCAIRGLLLSLDAGERGRIAEGLVVVGAITSSLGMRQGRVMHERAQALIEEMNDPDSRAIFLLWRAITELGDGKWREAVADADEAVELCKRCVDASATMQQALRIALTAVYLLGRYDELATRGKRAIVYAETRGNPYVNQYVQPLLALPRLMAGDVEGARAALHQDERNAAPGETTLTGVLVWRSVMALYEGRAAEELSTFATMERKLGNLSRHVVGLSSVAIARIALELQVLADAGRATPSSLRKVRRAIRTLSRIALPSIPGLVALYEASVAAMEGDRNGTVERLQAAISAFEAAGFQFERACALRRLGEQMGGPDGRDAVAEADAWMRARGVKDPARWTHCRAPGFPSIPGP